MALSNSYFDNTDNFDVKMKQSDLSRFEMSGEFKQFEIAVETIETFERFEQLEGDWNKLYARNAQPANVFQSFNWHLHWARNYLGKNTTSLRIVAAFAGDELVMLWPLVMSKSMGVRQLNWMGAPVSQYGDILIDRKIDGHGVAEAVWSYISSKLKVDLIALEKVRSDALVSAVLKAKKVMVTGCMKAPYLDLASATNYTEYEKRYSKKARKNRRRHRRRLSEAGPLEYKLVETGPEARALVAQTIGIKRDWLKDNGLVSRAYSDNRFDAFFADVAGSIDRQCGCLVSVIMSDKKPIAFDIGFRSGSSFVVHIGAYDQAFERFSPGSLLTEDFLNDCYDLGITHYDLLAPEAVYKMKWADDSVELCDYAYPINNRGFLYAKGVNWFLRNGVKKVLEHTPVKLLQVTRPLFRLVGL